MLGRLFLRRLGRTALRKKDATYFIWRYVRNASRAWQAQFAEREHPEAKQLGRKLGAAGILCGSSNIYLSGEGKSALAEASSLVLGLANAAIANLKDPQSGKRKKYLVELVRGSSIHEADSPLLKVALDTKLLEIVASYLGLWPSLYSIGAWLNYPIGEPPMSSQLWHRDPEDLRIVKVFIYLVDVDEECGPFCYIPGTQSFGERAHLVPVHKDSMRITDEEMATVIGPENWMQCTGPVGTMILADTVGFHRGGYAKDGNRVLITFTYTSGIPLKPRKARVKETPAWLKAQIQKAALPALSRPDSVENVTIRDSAVLTEVSSRRAYRRCEWHRRYLTSILPSAPKTFHPVCAASLDRPHRCIQKVHPNTSTPTGLKAWFAPSIGFRSQIQKQNNGVTV